MKRKWLKRKIKAINHWLHKDALSKKQVELIEKNYKPNLYTIV